MQHTTKYQPHDKAHATHNQILTKRQNPCNTQPNINSTVKPMQDIANYQQNENTHATQPNINKRIKPMQDTTNHQQHDETMQYTTKYQQTDKTHATHNQISTK